MKTLRQIEPGMNGYEGVLLTSKRYRTGSYQQIQFSDILIASFFGGVWSSAGDTINVFV